MTIKKRLLEYFPKDITNIICVIRGHTYIGKKGYTVPLSQLTEEKILKVKEELTFTPFRPKGYGPDAEPFSVYGISKEKMFLPKFYGIETFGKPDEIKISDGDEIKLEFNGSLRENQIAPVDACLKAAEETGGGILCLPCGHGKTGLALYLIGNLGKKALVVVNKEFLMDQWKERIQQFLPEARIGILRQKKVDIENKDIVIAMLQSVAMCDYPSSTYESFGIVFYDEVHCVPSKIFSKALRKINTKYHFGLSATPNRADGMTKVTKLYIGPIVYKIDPKTAKKNPKKLQVFTVAFDELPSGAEGKLYKALKNYQGKPNVVKMISNIIKCPRRLAMVSMILRYFVIKDKRHVLVLSERIQYIRDIEAKIKKDIKGNIPFKIGYYIGGMKEKERKESESADLILASYSMAKEAMDIPILDTLLMATSKSNIEQSIGRIQRKTEYPDEKPPLVIDIIDKFSSFHRQAGKREDFYRKKHYKVTDFIFNEDESDKLYEDFDEKIKLISSEIEPDIEDGNISLDEEDTGPDIRVSARKDLLNAERSSTGPTRSSTKPLIIQTKIDKDFFNMIGDGDFDL